MATEFLTKFLDPGTLVDGNLTLVLEKTSPADRLRGYSPYYQFSMVHTVTRRYMGHVNLRLSNERRIVLYAGHIGYGVEPAHRGNRYAARSCSLILPLAKRHGLSPLWITCNPDNLASRRTCELLGAAMVEIVSLPAHDPMYLRGDRQKCRYRLDL